MKARKIGLMGIIVMGMVCLFAINQGLATQWITCSVVRAGIQETDTGERIVLIRLTATDASFTNRYFVAAGTCTNEMLAVALTALSSGQNVRIEYDWATPYCPLYTIFLMAP